jgi:apolipoprotein N-acyltransferase
LAYDGWAWTRPEPDGNTVRVALIQPDIPLAVKHDQNTIAEQWSTLMEQTLQAAESDPDLIVWPESARPIPVVHDLDRPESWRMVEVQALAQRIGVPLLVGAEYVRFGGGESRRFYNAAFAVDAEGRLLEDWGAKIYLVPFVEATPFRSLFGPLVEGRGGEWRWLAGGFTPGPRNAVIDVADTKVGVLVCYEQLFPDLARGLRNAGAELQVVITNDAWFGRSLFPPYQANAARLRAIENRTGFVRVANTGISGFVDTHGRYHRRTRLFEKAVEVWDVPVSDRRTVYDRIGDVVAWLAVAGLVAACVAARSSASRGT